MSNQATAPESTPELRVTPLPSTPLNRRMAQGHSMRMGHALNAVSASSDGVLWHTVRLCCGETIPDTVPGWAETIPASPLA